MLGNLPPHAPHRCAARIHHRFSAKEKRARSLYTCKNWKFEKLLEETRAYIHTLHESGNHRYVSAESLSIHFRSKLKRMSQVISQLLKEGLLSGPINFRHDGCWSVTCYRVRLKNKEEVEQA